MEWITSYLTPVWNVIFKYVDGSVVDLGSLAVAVIWVLRYRWRIPKCDRCDFFSRETGKLLVNAISIFPLMLLAASIISTKLTEILLSGSRITLTIAGCYALCTMLEDLNGKQSDKENASKPEESMIPPLAPARVQHLPTPRSQKLQQGKVLADAANEADNSRRRKRRQSKVKTRSKTGTLG